MNYSFVDLGVLLLAVGLTFLLVPLPGAALAAGVNLFGFRALPAPQRLTVALLAGFALLPALYSSVIRLASVEAALVLAILLALGGLVAVVRGPGFSRPGIGAAVLAAWLAVVAAETVDFDVNGALYQSYLVIDTVKHAATIRAIADSGAPPLDPFFARPEPSAYYYFFYSAGALASRLGMGAIDARAAAAGLIFWMGPALYGLVLLIIRKGGFLQRPASRSVRMIVLALLLASGLDIVPMLLRGLGTGKWYPQLDMWNTAIASWADSLLWVPHHLASLLASWIGFVLLAEQIGRVEGGERARPIALVLAALAFVSSLGMSVWVTLVAALTAVLWFALLAWERRWAAVTVLALTGGLSLALAVPHLVDMASRAGEGIPIALKVREFDPLHRLALTGMAGRIARIALLPVNYGMELGVFLLGAILFWRRHRMREVHRNEVARLLSLSALSGFLFATFTASTLLLNDLAWRAPLALQLATLVWTAVEVDTILRAPRLPQTRRLAGASLAALVGLGWASTLYGLVAMRAYVAVPVVRWAAHVNAHPETDRAMRAAYLWMNRNLPDRAVTQHNPTARRVFDFGLYGRHNVGVADPQASLYGASKADVAARVAALGPIFNAVLSGEQACRVALREGVSHLAVTADDAPWRDRNSWVWRTRPAYQSSRVRVIPVASLCLDLSEESTSSPPALR